MVEKGRNIEPLPKVEFIDGDTENAKDFFGKTAYYDPATQTIVLYTESRHPKDIVRSFSHEMVHHTQNLEDRLEGIATTNTMEDENLDKIEQEANLVGTMTFRNWTDTINEDKDYFGLDALIKEIIEEPKYKIFSDMDGVLTDFDASFKKAICSALFNRALVGIQPQLRQTPPRAAFSTMAVLIPLLDARIAAT